eukprot:4250389-Amphidinium_carterae.1
MDTDGDGKLSLNEILQDSRHFSPLVRIAKYITNDQEVIDLRSLSSSRPLAHSVGYIPNTSSGRDPPKAHLHEICRLALWVIFKCHRDQQDVEPADETSEDQNIQKYRSVRVVRLKPPQTGVSSLEAFVFAGPSSRRSF